MKKALFLVLACLICIGCRSRGGVGGSGGGDSGPGPVVPDPVVQSETEKKGFNWKKVLQLVSFQKSDEQASGASAARLAELTEYAKNVGAKSEALDPSDSPEVTRQKAEDLLTALRPWESILAAGRSAGVVSDAAAEHLDGLVKQLRLETGKLMQFTPDPQTITIVKQLGSALQGAIEKSAVFMQRGSGIMQAFRSSPEN